MLQINLRKRFSLWWAAAVCKVCGCEEDDCMCNESDDARGDGDI